MDHLMNLNVVHADLSARNILLDHLWRCKISDFGLSKQLEQNKAVYTAQTQTLFPWAWMAPETLINFEFTVKSDIWSMGVTFWEIFTLGKQPHLGATFNSDFIEHLKQGMELEKPELASDEIFNEISKCWNSNPNYRPNPTNFIQFFEDQRNSVYATLEDKPETSTIHTKGFQNHDEETEF